MLVLILMLPIARAVDNDPSRFALELQPLVELSESGNFEAAIDRLQEKLVDNPTNPDIMVLLGVNYRQLGKFDVALKFYQQALTLQPRHYNANQYLGELYLQTHQFENAIRQFEILDTL